MIPDRLCPQRAELSVEGVCFVITTKQPIRNFESRCTYLHLTVLEVVQENVQALAVSTVVLDDDTRAANDLAGVTLLVDLAETSPGTEDLGVTDLDQVDLVLGAESLNELDVLSLRAGLDEDAKVGLTLVEGLSALTETASETVVNEGVLQDLLHFVDRASDSPPGDA